MKLKRSVKFIIPAVVVVLIVVAVVVHALPKKKQTNSADAAGNQRRPHSQTKQCVTRGEFGFDGVGRSVDHRRIVAVEQTTKSCDQSKLTAQVLTGLDGTLVKRRTGCA